ncbi:hypothetical protein [Congregicoccus parvus]
MDVEAWNRKQPARSGGDHPRLVALAIIAFVVVPFVLLLAHACSATN